MNVQMGQHDFGRVQTPGFIGSVIYDNNVNSEESLARIKKGNKAFFMYKKLRSLKQWRTQEFCSEGEFNRFS